ncbi:ABC transporter-like protein [Paenibacillus larvae subsp. larvae]|uniref:ABC transporter ATP-binding protein n=3 Tax=Paenibacillus larvae TaxID=1464 RepID=A0A1U9YNU4_9BACL|nr:ABC transporter ATP-binding protein [Paenibacillus larvae]AQT85087.1 ABC transporter ATP-binding protein [Paenibacillus larvae subsp. pulvifaciens]AQZ47090.1 ABC transporter ATP-binding protein [Paenibacillus larvae subsp. pulvifaciens]ARF68465.1 ABC transporter ATP-binding protein [Paenibacillus larvae subsp. pulvifaciens]AVF24369.1 ABC transporter-like protein [Paenibacillus larvae subsp. larvae]AVF29130.1 ABC transporter-like protein [Paenibacillus larvae subsp. larvae]
MNESGLLVQQVSKQIGKKTIVHPCSLKVRPGEVLALCGGNGAGKSTLLRMMAGLLSPTSGDIKLNGLEPKADRKVYAKAIGYMPDHYEFESSLTASETLRFFADLKRVGQVRMEAVLKAVGLSEVRHAKVSSLSKGMNQRLLFAQAMLASPVLMLLDEPTNGLDPYWADAFVSLIREAKSEGQAVVFSTHHLHIAEQIADQAAFLKEGRVVHTGPLAYYQEQYGEAGLQGAFNELFGFALSPENTSMNLQKEVKK